MRDAVQHYLVLVKGALYRKTPYILALFGDGVGLFDAFSGRATQMWRFAEDGVTVSSVPGDIDDVAITVKSKASGMLRMMGKTEAETRWVVTCAGNRSDIIMRVLSMREVALGDVPEPAVHMGAYRAAGQPPLQAGGPAPPQPVQLIVGTHSLVVSSAETGELLIDLAVCGMQRVRRLGDVENAFAIRHLHQWHIVVCDERNTVMTLLRQKCDCMGLSPDIIFGCSVPLAQVEKESGQADRLRRGGIENWSVLLQPPPKVAFAAAGWRNASARKRTLILTAGHLLECDADNSRVLWARELASIRGLKRSLPDPQRFTVEFADGHFSTYDSPHRDLITAAVWASLTSPSCVAQAGAGKGGGDDQGCGADGSNGSMSNPDSHLTNTLPPMHLNPPRLRVADAPSTRRLLPASAPTDTCIVAEQVFVKKLAGLVDSGVLLGGDDDDVLNPLVVEAAADLCANCLGSVLTFEGREVETAVLSLVKQLQRRTSLDRVEPSDIICMLESLKLLAGTKTGWLTLAKAEGGKDEWRAGIASAVLGLSSQHDEVVLASLGLVLALVAPACAALRSPTLQQQQEAPGGTVAAEQRMAPEVQKNMEGLREELFTEAVCQRLATVLAPRSNKHGGAAIFIIWEVLRIWQALVCEPGKKFSSARLIAACTSCLLSDNGVVTALLSHPCRPVSSAAWHVVQEMVDSGVEEGFLVRLQQSALGDGGVLRHLHSALFHADAEQQAVSRRMCALWIEGSADAHNLLTRCLPVGMARLMPDCSSCYTSHSSLKPMLPLEPQQHSQNGSSATAAPTSGTHKDPDDSGARGGTAQGTVQKSFERTLRASPALAASLAVRSGGGSVDGAVGCNTASRAERCKARAAWETFLEHLLEDRLSINVRWNGGTRSDLRLALENEAKTLEHARQHLGLAVTAPQHQATAPQQQQQQTPGSHHFAWNHEEFSIEYGSLSSEMCIDGILLREALDAVSTLRVSPHDFLAIVPHPHDFFLSLYRSLLQGVLLPPQVSHSRARARSLSFSLD